jgi:hypothetical protein
LSYPEDGAIQGRHDRYAAHTLSLNFRLARYLEAAISGTLNSREAGVEATRRSRYYIGFSLTWGSRGSGMAMPFSALIR